MIRSREFRVESLEQKPAASIIALAGYKFIVVTFDSKLSTQNSRLSTEYDDIY